MPKNSSSIKKPRGKKATAETDEVREEIQAPYYFTDAERLDMSRTQNEDLEAIGELIEQKKQSAQDFKLRIESAQNRVSQVQNKIRSGYETRPLVAIVTFDPEKRKKTFLHPETREEIRTEDMTPADFQREMFRKDELTKKDGETNGATGAATPQPEKKPGKKAPEQGENAGQTNVGDALGKAAAQKPQPKLVFDIARSKSAYDSSADVTRAFKAAAKAAGWDKPAVALIADQLKAADTMDAMYAVLEPHCIAAPEDAAE